MSYQQFAYLYDRLMQDAPYPEWVSFLTEKTTSYKPDARRILDVGCGTGSLSISLAQNGFEVTGVDLSSDMLLVAKEKAESANADLSLFQQDMRELEGLGIYDCVTIFCDSLNYLSDEKDIKDTFLAVHKHLPTGGLFLFDVHSIHKMNEVFIGNTFGSNDEELAYLWHCFQGEFENSVEHELTFFMKTGHTYTRFDELHFQRTFTVETYTEWLKEAGFDLLEIIGDFIPNKALDSSDRILFTAIKKST